MAATTIVFKLLHHHHNIMVLTTCEICFIPSVLKAQQQLPKLLHSHFDPDFVDVFEKSEKLFTQIKSTYMDNTTVNVAVSIAE